MCAVRRARAASRPSSESVHSEGSETLAHADAILPAGLVFVCCDDDMVSRVFFSALLAAVFCRLSSAISAVVSSGCLNGEPDCSGPL